MRTKLSLAVMYLLSCKQSIAEDIKRRAASCSRGLWPSDYLYTDIHLYSITGLENEDPLNSDDDESSENENT
uniref:Secreted protein n=1 Tax=Ditylenchus dipsaci TaxID=166011 RepID=A0A915CST0_9BILA